MNDWIKRNFCNWPFGVVMISSFLLVYLIPPDLIRSIPGMNAYLLAIPKYIPGITACINASNFYDIAAVYYPLMFLISFLAIFEMWCLPVGVGRGKWNMSFANNPWKYIFVTLGTLVFLPIFFYLCFVNGVGTTQFNSMPHNESKFFMAVLGPVVSGAVFWAFLGALLRVIFSAFFETKYK